MILGHFGGSGGTPEQHWDPGSIFSENGTRKTPNPSPFLESVFYTFRDRFLQHILGTLQTP